MLTFHMWHNKVKQTNQQEKSRENSDSETTHKHCIRGNFPGTI